MPCDKIRKSGLKERRRVRMKKKTIVSENVFKGSDFCHAIKVGNTIYTSGQVGYDRNAHNVKKGDCLAQAEQAFENLKHILQAAGASMKDVVKITYYYRDIEDSEMVRSKVAPKYFGDHKPAATAVVVHSMVKPDILIEFD